MSTAALDLKTLILNGRDAGRHYADLAEAITSCSVKQTITGASTIDLSIADARRTLVQSAALTERSRLVLDKAGYTLVKVAKSGGRVNLTFEDDAVAELRTHNSYKKIAAGTMTRPAFVTSLIREVPSVKVVVAPGASKSLNELARGSGSPTKGSSKVISGGQVVDSGAEDTWTAAARIMGEINWRVFCYRGTITIAPDSWLMAHNGKVWDLNPSSPGVHDIDFNWDVGKPAATATITADAGFRDLAPGQPVTLSKLGIANGKWLVESIDRNPYSKLVTVSVVRPQPILPEPAGHDPGDGGDMTFDPDFAPEPSDESGVFGSGQGREEGVTPDVDRFVRTALAQQGKPYVYGTRGPDSWDCAGFTYWCAKQVGYNFPNPVSSQVALCRKHGTTMTVDQAIRTRGALIFRSRGGGASDHVVISLGDGRTIEARGRAYGVVVCKVYGRDWTSGGFVPGMHVNVAQPRRGGRGAV